MTTINQRVDTSDETDQSDHKAHPGRRMTEEEFVGWSGDAWVEWIDGEVLVMSPVNLRHAILFGFLHPLMSGFVQQRDLGQVLSEPFQMRLPAQRRRRSPDLMFIANARLDALHPDHLDGPADLVVEIVSPQSLARDWREKYLEYEAAGVREYWIVDPMANRLETYALGEDRRYQLIAELDGKINSIVLPGFYLRPHWLSQEKPPKLIDALREMGISF